MIKKTVLTFNPGYINKRKMSANYAVVLVQLLFFLRIIGILMASKSNENPVRFSKSNQN